MTPILYLLFVNHFASNALLFDDWRMVPFLNAVTSWSSIPGSTLESVR